MLLSSGYASIRRQLSTSSSEVSSICTPHSVACETTLPGHAQPLTRSQLIAPQPFAHCFMQKGSACIRVFWGHRPAGASQLTAVVLQQSLRCLVGILVTCEQLLRMQQSWLLKCSPRGLSCFRPCMSYQLWPPPSLMWDAHLLVRVCCLRAHTASSACDMELLCVLACLLLQGERLQGRLTSSTQKRLSCSQVLKSCQ